MRRRTAWAAACVAVLFVNACVSADVRASPQATTTRSSVDVRVTDDEVVLHRPDGEILVAALTAEDGRVEHAALRPGDHDRDTVLLLTVVEDRYELRYVIVADDGASDLYWLPWRLQVSEDLTPAADVPPLPVWAPDGSAFAWLERDADGTRLRTIGWRDTPEGGNPSDDAAAYQVAEVPAGAQLVRWDVEDGQPVLVATVDGVAWRIQLDLEQGKTYASTVHPSPRPRRP